MEGHRPSTVLSMDSSATSHDDLDLEMSRQVILSGAPDINLPLSAERSPPPPLQQQQQPWIPDMDILDVCLGPQIYKTTMDSSLSLPKVTGGSGGRKCVKRVDTIWGAWFFFSFYFRPAISEKSKAKIIRDSRDVSGFEKSDLNLDVFIVQHDMENMYMWVFKERPENALGKMQLRSYMNGHSRQGERPFPFSADKGFTRSHRMQRKHYRGLSNPQCIHGVELVPSPNLMSLNEEDHKRWVELTGRDLNFSILPEASDFGSWRGLPITELELERLPALIRNIPSLPSKKQLNGSGLNLSANPPVHSNGDRMDLSPVSGKRRKDFFSHSSEDDSYLPVIPPKPERVNDVEFLQQIEPLWAGYFHGVMVKNVYGPVTAAKTIYEDAQAFLIIISLPFVDLQRVKVSWRNTLTHGIIKVSCMSTSGAPIIKRLNRTFKLTDPSSEHCPPGEFVREIPLSTRIPEDANIEAYYDGPGSVLEIMVPKLHDGPEEHEVRVCLRPHLGSSDLMLT
ncbi:hypothetical protein SAY86_029988 [Trapa natans]|uniref:HSP20-like chaperones superfamily protein n=1 Tax=Trapa natans TaxID=22666 RepID=A0AAN7MFB7_TRANT|nr:hypothetical protein SAY86_029988 [Trapa natans]